MKKIGLILGFCCVFSWVGCSESGEAHLQSLAVSSGTLTPAFSVEEDTYALSINAPSIEMTPTTKDPHATVLMKEGDTPYGIILSGVAETVTLKVGVNVIRLQVVAENGYDFKDYVVTITR